ncbi:hypothetical protein K504DRAFT_538212 [Pleomassaria siparia CBS 279.74]|uniref:Uncharacterized protein n=1 Tax=Pleomassaria siparia CBS 279.74 TaxID=1314801 RepID=A0A6G1JVH6_9PLEO|nr:hypothetical protein K504DRAFT_538212 [Pleomassaria siparia CBS 279.74]
MCFAARAPPSGESMKDSVISPTIAPNPYHQKTPSHLYRGRDSSQRDKSYPVSHSLHQPVVLHKYTLSDSRKANRQGTLLAETSIFELRQKGSTMTLHMYMYRVLIDCVTVVADRLRLAFVDGGAGTCHDNAMHTCVCTLSATSPTSTLPMPVGLYQNHRQPGHAPNRLCEAVRPTTSLLLHIFYLYCIGDRSRPHPGSASVPTFCFSTAVDTSCMSIFWSLRSSEPCTSRGLPTPSLSWQTRSHSLRAAASLVTFFSL